jgi:hypothetical protein
MIVQISKVSEMQVFQYDIVLYVVLRSPISNYLCSYCIASIIWCTGQKLQKPYYASMSYTFSSYIPTLTLINQLIKCSSNGILPDGND